MMTPEPTFQKTYWILYNIFQSTKIFRKSQLSAPLLSKGCTQIVAGGLFFNLKRHKSAQKKIGSLHTTFSKVFIPNLVCSHCLKRQFLCADF